MVLHLIANGPDLPAGDALALNKLRRRCERWTDMLLGYLSGLGGVEELAFDVQRTRDFAEDLSYGQTTPGGPATWALFSASLKTMFRDDLSPASPSADLNQQIAAATVSNFPAEIFAGTAFASDQWLSRLTRTTDDAQGMINAFLRM